jgi:hypothetical protein
MWDRIGKSKVVWIAVGALVATGQLWASGEITGVHALISAFINLFAIGFRDTIAKVLKALDKS